MARCGAELLVQCLSAHGVGHVFGIPGAKVDRVFDVLVDQGPELVVCRHEQNAAFIAAAIGRITGRPGVCLTTSGPGAGNLVTGLATATTEGDPVVALSGAVARSQRFKRTHQAMDTPAMFNAVTRMSLEVEDADAVPEVIANAFRVASGPRPGAAFISLPQDVLNDPVTAEVIEPGEPPAMGVAEASVLEHAARLIDNARMPVLLLGSGASQPAVAEAVRAWLRRHPMPVICTYEGAGVIPRDLLSCFVGRIGLFRNQPGDRLLAAADAILAIGFDPVEYDPVLWNKGATAPIIHLDDAPADIDRCYRPALELVGDVGATLDALGGRVAHPEAASDLPLVQDLRKELLAEQARGATLAGAPVHPLRLMHELRDMIGDDVTVTCDVGSHYIWMARYFFSYEPRRLLFSNGQQTLGVALPWAIGASIARPGEKVVSVSGDGGFLFSAMELETAVRLKAPIVHLVWRDGSYDMVRIQQMLKYGRESGVRFDSPDIVRFAESFGATGLRIDHADAIRPVLKQALEAEGPVLVDVPIDYRDNDALCADMHPGMEN